MPNTLDWVAAAVADSDPRADNCRAFNVGPGGKVTGVQLDYVRLAGATFRLVSVSLIDEASAGGNTVANVAIVDQHGAPVTARCYLAYAWDGTKSLATLKERLLPGAQKWPVEHPITNGYDPNRGNGPLAIYLADSAGVMFSDVVAGLGLPGNRHVCYHIVYQEGAAVIPEPPEPEPGACDLTPIFVQLDDIEAEQAEGFDALEARLTGLDAKWQLRWEAVVNNIRDMAGIWLPRG